LFILFYCCLFTTTVLVFHFHSVVALFYHMPTTAIEMHSDYNLPPIPPLGDYVVVLVPHSYSRHSHHITELRLHLTRGVTYAIGDTGGTFFYGTTVLHSSRILPLPLPLHHVTIPPFYHRVDLPFLGIPFYYIAVHLRFH